MVINNYYYNFKKYSMPKLTRDQFPSEESESK